MTTTRTQTPRIQTTQLGKAGPTVSRIGLGGMSMSGVYGDTDEKESFATIDAAFDAGIDLIDTGDFYGSGYNEALIGRALQGRRREDFKLSVKFGALRGPDGSWGGIDTRPEAMKNFLTYSMQRLGVDYLDIYRPARLDPAVPIEETVGGLAEMVEAGYIRHIGLSEVGSDTLRRAAAVHPIADLQIEYSLISRGIEAEILPTARELGIGITAYGVLSRGLLSDSFRQNRTIASNDYRAHSPRFQGENLTKNLELVEVLAAIAEEKNATVAQLAIAWVLAQGDDIVPVIGARSADRMTETIAAETLSLSTAELGRIEAAVPAGAASGTRYPEAMMGQLDSER